MPRTCTICTSPHRAEIELSATNGMPLRHIAQQHHVDFTAISRHMKAHIKQAARQLQKAKDEAKTLDVLAQLRAINATTLRILQDTQRDKKTYGLALQAIDRIQKQIELQAKLLGDLDTAPQVNVWLPAPWQEIELAIASALLPWPDAAVAVSDALGRMEVGNAGYN